MVARSARQCWDEFVRIGGLDVEHYDSAAVASLASRLKLDPTQDIGPQLEAQNVTTEEFIDVSLPKIRSFWIRSMSQNHRIIRADVCDPARAVDLRCRHFQVATQAGSREPVSSSSA
jgi:hypothetical protein